MTAFPGHFIPRHHEKSRIEFRPARVPDVVVVRE